MARKPKAKPAPIPEDDKDPVEAAATLLEAELDEGNPFVEHWLQEEYEDRFNLDADTVADAMHGMLPMDLQVFCERLAMRSGPYVRDAILKALGA